MKKFPIFAGFVSLALLLCLSPAHAASKKKEPVAPTVDTAKVVKELRKELDDLEAKLVQLRSDDGKMDDTKRMSKDERKALVADIKACYAHAALLPLWESFDDNQKGFLNQAFKRLNTEIKAIKSAPGASYKEQADDQMALLNYPEAAKLYEKAESQAPKESDEAAEALFYVGYANSVQGGNSAACSTWDRVQKRYPKSKWAATSLAYIIQFHMGSVATKSVAEKETLQLIRDYPDSPEAAAAKLAMATAKAGTNAPPAEAAAAAPPEAPPADPPPAEATPPPPDETAPPAPPAP